jgi:NADH-quinone oxidoreductase subunit F
MSKNLSALAKRKGVVDSLFERMGEAATKTGAPSQEEMTKLAKEFLVGNSNVYGATTAYDFMKPENKGKKAYVCNGSACLCAGTQDKVHEVLETKFSADEIGHMTCLGRCHENGSFHFNGKNYSNMNEEEILKVINNEDVDNADPYTIESNLAMLTKPFRDFDTHYDILRGALKKSPEEILEEIKKSELRGRGGAGFAKGYKLEACKNTESDMKFIICNADEGDPGAFSDKFLLEHRPHAVLFGMMIAGYVVGAEWGILYIRAEYPESIKVINQAIQELEEHGCIGENIADSGFNFNFKVIRAQGAYICGEETALINSLEGQRPEVRARPPYPAISGLYGKPTVVNNVETLAAVHYIIEHSGVKHAELGTEKSSGTKLMSLDSFFNKPGLYEVEMGTPLEEVINMAGGFKKPVKALQIGGPLGGIVPAHKFKDLNISFESFAKHGFMLGHASVVCIPEDFPMIKYLEHLFDFAQFESCGKCFPCRLGTKRAHEMLNSAMKGDYKIARNLFDDLMDTLEQGSLCMHGGGIPLPAKNALEYFGGELSAYFENN